MNKRIHQLYREAWHWLDTPECEYQGREEDILIPDEFVEKFAELLVKECADWIDNVKDEQGDYIHDAFYWAALLKKHFGVDK